MHKETHNTKILEALDEFPLIKNFIIEVAETTQAPIEACIATALTTTSILSQAVIDVERPGGLIGPVSLLTILIANSGERKTTVEKAFMSPILEYIEDLREEHRLDIDSWSIKIETWEARKRKLINDISKHSSFDAEHHELEEAIKEHQRIKPQKPKEFKLIYEDTTTAALLKGLSQDLPWAALTSSEGISVLKGAFNDFGKINSLWSGSNIEVSRATVDGCSLSDARLTVGIMVQREVLREYLESKGERARAVGLLSRALVFHPKSTQGSRFITDRTINKQVFDEYRTRVVELLDKIKLRLKNKNMKRTTIHLSPSASIHWSKTFNTIEAGLIEGGEYERSKDHASKLSENIVRVAAALHYFERNHGEITLEELKAAESIVLECSKTFRDEFSFMPKIVNDAETLLNWMELKCSGTIIFRWIEKNKILQTGPTRLRSVSRLNQALDCLVETGKVIVDNRSRPARVILK